MKSIKDTCYENIGNYTSIDALYALFPNNKHESISRKLRELTHENKVKPVMKNGAIVAYMRVFEAVILKTNMTEKEANEKLRAYLRGLKPSYDIYDQIQEIEKAIGSKYMYLKVQVLKKYGIL